MIMKYKYENGIRENLSGNAVQ